MTGGVHRRQCDGERPGLGSAIDIAQRHATRQHGMRAAWAAEFGNDLFSQFMLDAVRREGLDERLFRIHNHPVRRLAAALSFPHDRAFVSYADETPGIALAPLVAQERPSLVHLPAIRTGALHT